MSKVNFEDQLPRPNVPVKDAIYAIADKMPRFSRENMFEQTDFLKEFIARLQSIVDQILIHEARRELEEEIAYILYDLDTKHDIELTFDTRHPQLRKFEAYLKEQ
jgi:hypothetical protein